MYEAKQYKESKSRTLSQSVRKGVQQVQKTNSRKDNMIQKIMQRKAGIESFHVAFSSRPEGIADSDGIYASFLIDSHAQFKDGTNNYSAADAEFRQEVATKEIVKDSGGNVVIDVEEGWKDDNYNRAADPDMYDGNTFHGTDVPGYDADNPVSPGDELNYTFQSEQKIVDTSDNDKVIATTGKHTAKIEGEYPRNFILPDEFSAS